MGVVRINAIGPGAVEYLLHGCDPVHQEPVVELDGPAGPGEGPQREQGQQQEAGPAHGGGRWVKQQGAGYYLDAVEHGEPAGRWLGSGIEALGLSMRSGDLADPDALRAIFGELRYPESERPGSTKDTPVSLGNKPRKFSTLSERVEKALKADPDATYERQQEIELDVAQKKSPSATAYYDVTFSPVKSASVYYAALLAAGDTETAQAIRDAHDQAVRMAIESMEKEVAWARTGTHGRATKSGQTVGEWQPAVGFAAVLFAHHTNRDAEPQLHAHVAVLNRVALEDGRIFALDGKAFGPVVDAMQVAYDRAFEALVSDAAGVVFATRPDGKGREIAGMRQELLDEASTRTRENVQPKLDQLTQEFKELHGGMEPGPRARSRIRDRAVKATRQPKAGPAGPAAVAAWVDREPGRRERLEGALADVQDATFRAGLAGQAPPMTREQLLATDGQLAAEGPAATRGQLATDGPAATGERAAAREALAATAVPAGLAYVQAKYATWTIGNLVEAIDRHLGDDAGALGLGIAARHAWVWELAERTVHPESERGVVQVRLGDPVPVPPELRREVDGHSRFRPHKNERYATAEHVAVEQRLAAVAMSGGARSLAPEVVAAVAGQAQVAGLSSDQVAALAGVLSSERRVEVLVGPAGAGKSHTLARLATVWTEQHGGTVFGTATAEIATRNLAGLGMEAINTRQLINQLTPDERGLVSIRLTGQDLVVMDEAGMISTPDFQALTEAVERAGAKMVWSGDHHQLSGVGAGGMFAHVAGRPGALELEQVHRFTQAWEREASLQLRTGDAAVASTYADEGRLRLGTQEQMEYQASRDYLADRLAGVSSLVIVGSNDQAKQLSRDIQQDLLRLDLLGAAELTKLPDGTRLHAGDLIQTRENNAQLRVDGGVDEQGRAREALPVTNRELYTVIGYDAEAKTLLARDERGAVAHLPQEYVKQHVALAYAVTNHSAQGVTVQRGRHVAGRDASRESLYPASTRGFEHNMIYLVTEVDADAHDPNRVRDTAQARMVQILERSGTEQAAITMRDEAIAELSSMHTLGDYYDRVATERGHSRHAELVAEHLGSGIYADQAFPALLGRLRAVELGGHDVAAVFEEALAQRSMAGARSPVEVMHARVGWLIEGRAPVYTADEVAEHRAAAVRPPWKQLAEQHHQRAAATGDQVETMLGRLADKAHARTEELGAATAAEPPAWALEWLGTVPDAELDPAGHRQWTVDAGQVAAYREYRGVPAEQVSIGEAPPESQQLAHELWTRAAGAGAGDPRAVDWRRASDADLHETVARWEREQQWAPLLVAGERGDALALAHDAGNDAVTGRARLQAMGPDDPGREQLEARVRADEVMAEHAAGFAASLDDAHAARTAWWAETSPQREAAAGARRELARRDPTAEQHQPEQHQPEQQPEQGRAAQGGVELNADQQQQSGGRAPRGEQQALPLDLDSERVQGRNRFADGFAAGREEGLAEVDPEQAMTRREREALFGKRVGQELHDELRREHGERLDPEGQLSDRALAQVRLRELADATPHDTPDTDQARLDQTETTGAQPAATELPERGDQPGEDIDQPAQRADELGARPHNLDQRETGDGEEQQVPRSAAAPGIPGPAEPADLTATSGVREPTPTAQAKQAEQVELTQPAEPAEPAPAEQHAEPEPAAQAEPAEGAVANPVDDAMRELRRVERNVYQARTSRERAKTREEQIPAPAAEPKMRPLEEMESEAAADDEIAQRREAGLGQRSRERERQIEHRRDDGLELD